MLAVLTSLPEGGQTCIREPGVTADTDAWFPDCGFIQRQEQQLRRS